MFIYWLEECRVVRCYAMTLVRTDVSEGLTASIIRVTRIGEPGKTLAETINRRTRRNILVDGILHSYRHENRKSYIALTSWAL
jgi:hypothetical protein